jgi:tetratricopeptide (TPR) repeat protein
LPPDDAITDFNEVLEITSEIDLVSEKTWVSWSMGLFHIMQGHFGQALKGIQDGLRIASEVGHREWIVGNQWALSLLYGELLAPEKALQQLEGALPLARELRSQIWIRNVTGALARAYILLDDLASAQTCLETVLSPQTPMDALGKRLCWARWAELALAQGDPVLALDITDRLIASVPGMLPGQVVTFLWKLKGKALAAMGETEEACSLLYAALDNAHAAGERFLLWRIHASLGQIYHASGRPAKAQREFSAARDLVRELADTIPDKVLKDNFYQKAFNTFRMCLRCDETPHPNSGGVLFL